MFAFPFLIKACGFAADLSLANPREKCLFTQDEAGDLWYFHCWGPFSTFNFVQANVMSSRALEASNFRLAISGKQAKKSQLSFEERMPPRELV